MYCCRFIFGFIVGLLLIGCSESRFSPPVIVSQDVTNFWEAYDSVLTTSDTILQRSFIERLFIDKASVGQQRMIRERSYTADDYLNSILNHPRFWRSIRPNMQDFKQYNAPLSKGVNELRAIYPELSESTLYYTVGAHRSPGTGVDSLVLIGCEFALGDSTVVTDELPEYLHSYYDINPTDHLRFLTVHEYVHTQQSGMIHDLLSLALYEGIADFVAETATDQRSPFKAFVYGPANNDKIKERFAEDMFNPNSVFRWLWNSSNNEFNTRDLGYYVGHAIASGHYQNSKDKKKAIKELIELNYSDRAVVERLVDSSHYFDEPISELEKKYDQLRPTVESVEPAINGKTNVELSVDRLTIRFSEPMNDRYRNFDFGPLGEDALLRITGLIGYSDDRKAMTISIAPLESNKQYQLTIGSGFRNDRGIPLRPYLIDFTTGG